ncbi:hypothetical protein Fcan01_16912 [Folsomia candida]|uniref:Uncharacterized protein n=1 Tax=Folsomia candida TaxID=158441 RepID=A0A226DS75_FOLCA|nr:hypothetical protein Fcan01_16912 [Folsomia candida]
MFTDLFSQEFSKTIKTANRFGFSLIWDRTKRRLQFSPKFHSKTKLVTKYIFLYTFNVLVQTARHKFMPNSPDFNLLMVMSYAWIGMSVGVYLLANQPKEMARSWNGIFLISVKIHGKQILELPWLNRSDHLQSKVAQNYPPRQIIAISSSIPYLVSDSPLTPPSDAHS